MCAWADPSEMHQLLARNPGLKSRFATTIDFPDYTAEELMQIADGMLRTLSQKARNPPLPDPAIPCARLAKKHTQPPLERLGCFAFRSLLALPRRTRLTLSRVSRSHASHALPRLPLSRVSRSPDGQSPRSLSSRKAHGTR